MENKTSKPALQSLPNGSSGRTGRYVKYAIGEIILVVIGILIALQINNWNEERKNTNKEAKILRSLQSDLNVDLQNVKIQLLNREKSISDYTTALDILSNKKQGTKEELNTLLSTILQVGGLDLNKTTFNNLQTTGEIRLIKNKTLADSIVGYYNTGYLGWETALRDYTRNQIGPYFMDFDFLPYSSLNYKGYKLSYYGTANDFDKAQKTLQDYKNDYFIINALRQKMYNMQGLIVEYKILIDYAEQLNKSIDRYLEHR